MTFFLSLLGLGATLVYAPQLAALPAVAAALVSVLVGIALASLLARRPSPEAVGLGAVGALAHSWLIGSGFSPALAFGVFAAFVFGARARRSPTAARHLAQLALAAACGAGAAAVVLGYAGAVAGIQAAAIVLGTLVAAAPLVMGVDDAVTYELLGLARGAHGTLRFRLLKAAVVRRRMRQDVRLGRRAAKHVEQAFDALLRTARARASARAASAELLDRRLAEYVRRLGRTYIAASTAHDLEDGVDDRALAALRLHGDDIEVETRAMVEAERGVSDASLSEVGEVTA